MWNIFTTMAIIVGNVMLNQKWVLKGSKIISVHMYAYIYM